MISVTSLYVPLLYMSIIVNPLTVVSYQQLRTQLAIQFSRTFQGETSTCLEILHHITCTCISVLNPHSQGHGKLLAPSCCSESSC